MDMVSVFGDSLARGVVFDNPTMKYKTLSECFVEVACERLGMQVNNYSKFGCTVKKGLETVEKHLDAVADSAYTVLEFGGNDCDFDWKAVSEFPNDAHNPRTQLCDFVVIYKDIIRKVRAVGGNPIVLNLPPIDSDKYFAWISSGLCGDSIKGWLGGDTDFIYRWHELYNQQVCALTSKMGVPVIDIRSAFLEKFDYGKLLCIDGIHPNVDGHALICSVIEKTVRTALRIQ